MTSLPLYIVFSRNDQYYIECYIKPEIINNKITEDQISTTQWDQSCINTIKLHQSNNINDNYAVMINKDDTRDNIIDLDHNRLWLINITDYSTTSPSRVNPTKGCKFCIIEIKCRQTIQYSKQIYHAHIEDCKTNSLIHNEQIHIPNFHIINVLNDELENINIVITEKTITDSILTNITFENPPINSLE